jgi:hypothetical protein
VVEVVTAWDRADLFWEYDQEIINVHTFEDPENSRPALVQVRRRIVGRWEPYKEQP